MGGRGGRAGPQVRGEGPALDHLCVHKSFGDYYLGTKNKKKTWHLVATDKAALVDLRVWTHPAQFVSECAVNSCGNFCHL